MRHSLSDVGDLPDKVRDAAWTLDDERSLDPLMEQIGDARFVLLGEASHGTSEYYTWRARISQRLIREKGFSFIGVEGDWPACYEVNRFIKGHSDPKAQAFDVLHAFTRWPTWMWANWEMVAFSEWLRHFNQDLDPGHKVGFYGLDVYSLWESMSAIFDFLAHNDPDALAAAHEAAACFAPYGESEQAYARATALMGASCEDEVVTLLARIREQAETFPADLESAFSAEQNAHVVANAESYYRTMVHPGPDSWNLRDLHMADTLDRLVAHHGPDARAIVWEHNTHIGDARATDMAANGMFNIGQVARERYGGGPDDGDGVVLVGFGSHRGSVIAGSAWGAPMERMLVPQAVPGSWEEAFHLAGPHDQLVLTPDLGEESDVMTPRGHRAIGVVYRPSFDPIGNWVPTVLPRRYDAFIYIEESQALHPLHIRPGLRQAPETYPWGV